PEPHAITDCYALIKVLSSKGETGPLRLVVNRVQSEAEAADISRKMTFASKRFLHTELTVLGHIAEDPAVSRSVRRQEPLLLCEPRSVAVSQIGVLAHRLLGEEVAVKQTGGAQGFLRRMRRLIPGFEGRL